MRNLVTVLVSFVALSSCVDAQEAKPAKGASDAITESSTATNQLANPAATYCIETGGEYEITKAADGSESGVCTLADGIKLDAWDYFRAQKN